MECSYFTEREGEGCGLGFGLGFGLGLGLGSVLVLVVVVGLGLSLGLGLRVKGGRAVYQNACRHGRLLLCNNYIFMQCICFIVFLCECIKGGYMKTTFYVHIHDTVEILRSGETSHEIRGYKRGLIVVNSE
jgi:hypothetical protein